MAEAKGSVLAKTGRTTLILGICAASWIITVLIYAIFNPFGTGLGYAFSPARDAISYPIVLFEFVIPVCALMYLHYKRQEWVAPPGKYSPDVKYKVSSTYTWTAIAVVIAIYCITGIPTGINIDMPSIIAAFTAVYFGPLVVFLAFTIGIIPRYLVGGASWAAPAMLPMYGMMDGGVWAMGSVVFWRIMRGDTFLGMKLSGITRTIMTVVSIEIMQMFHFIGWVGTYETFSSPWPASGVAITVALSTWYPTAIIFALLGGLLGEAAYRMQTAGKRNVM